VAISPDGKILASGAIDNTVRLWNLEQQVPLATLSGYPDWVLSVAFSQDGNTLISGGRDGTIAIWSKSVKK
jgi:WD40 repeat protein